LPVDPAFGPSINLMFGNGYRNRSERTFTALITGGGEGAGAILPVVEAIDRAGLPVRLLVACGRNRRLQQQLANQNCQVLSFTSDMPCLLAQADAVIGKAGALTVGEAVVAARPMIISQPLPGQEQDNAEFAVRQGIAVRAPNPPAVVQIIRDWIADPTTASSYVHAGEQLRQEWGTAADRIATIVMNLAGRQENILCQMVGRVR
jgi:processive 1,2-diacylglycerol beta-glucosyltransferase